MVERSRDGGPFFTLADSPTGRPTTDFSLLSDSTYTYSIVVVRDDTGAPPDFVIRSARTLCTELTGPGAAAPVAPVSCAVSLTADAVSYTHLTLPTICSV